MAEEYEFAGKVVLITGSSGGLGSNIACEFAKRGANVIITGRNETAVNTVAEECTSLSPNESEAFPFVADVTNRDDLTALINAIIEKFSRLDIVINNAGGGSFSSIYDDMLVDKIDQMLKLNLMSVVMLTQLAVPYLEQTQGSIVNISTILAQRPNIHFAPYCVAKSALAMFTKCIALELGPKNIRVNCVCPTAIRTNFQAASGGGDTLEAVVNHLEEIIPLGRITTVDDVSNAVLFLASNKSSFITGTDLVVDGGNSQL